ncbi:MAG TPA: ABC transporter ATP-binding protein [Mycobacteriales bacterium]|nr:ABC transporter ATP-binding protein [Mycobacteriales bacterium]
MSAPVVVEVAGLVKQYRKSSTRAVDGVDFEVRRGEFFALLGPNGAGKTTTISILTTTLLPTSGTVRVVGHDVVTEPAAVRERVGIIFQQPSLDLNLTGEQNVRLHAILYGVSPYRTSYRAMPKGYRDTVGELAELLGLGEEIFRPVRTLSGGMKRKLEILRSLLHRPEVLFLDEPTAGLDPASRRDLWSYLRTVQEESGTTVFLTTHYLEEAEDADRVCVIARGRVQATGSPRELTQRLVGQQEVVIDADDRTALAAELKRRRIASTGDGPFHVVAADTDVAPLLARIKTPLTLVRTHAPTLEDAYLDIIASAGHAEEPVDA